MAKELAGWARIVKPTALSYDEGAQYRAGLKWPGQQVVVGYCVGQKVEPKFEEALRLMRDVDVLAGSGRFRDRWCLTQTSGANLSLARNQLVRRFLALPGYPPWLLMVDTDMVPPPHALENLLDWATPDRIVGGLCFTHGPNGRIVPTMFDQDSETGFFTPWPEDEPIPDNTVQPVYGTGAAFLLVHRDALHRIGRLTPGPDCWFREVERHHPTYGWSWTSEDLFFCDQAARAGIGVYVHTGVEVGHVKPIVLNRRLFDKARNDVTWG